MSSGESCVSSVGQEVRVLGAGTVAHTLSVRTLKPQFRGVTVESLARPVRDFPDSSTTHLSDSLPQDPEEGWSPSTSTSRK